MSIQSVLDHVHARAVGAPSVLEEGAQAVKGRARQAAADLGERYEGARDTVEKGAEKAKLLTIDNLFRAYDVASRLVPMILPERAARVRSRRMAYAAIGGVVLGAGAIAVVEMRKPGTIAGLFKKARRAAARALDDVEHRVEEGKQTLEQRIDATKEHAAEGARTGTERVAEAVGTKISAIPPRVEAAAKDAKSELAGVKDKVLRTIDAIESDKRAPRVADGNHRP